MVFLPINLSPTVQKNLLTIDFQNYSDIFIDNQPIKELIIWNINNFGLSPPNHHLRIYIQFRFCKATHLDGSGDKTHNRLLPCALKSLQLLSLTVFPEQSNKEYNWVSEKPSTFTGDSSLQGLNLSCLFNALEVFFFFFNC